MSAKNRKTMSSRKRGSNRISMHSLKLKRTKQSPFSRKNLLLLLPFIFCISCTGLFSGLPKDVSPPKDIPCIQHSDCVIISKGCCPCNMGGAPHAIHKLQKEAYKEYLKCEPHQICAASYRCEEWEASTPQCLNSQCILGQ